MEVMSNEGMLFLLACFLICILLKNLMQKIRVPYVFLLVVVGFCFSEVFVRLGHDTGIRTTNFSFLINTLFVPAIIFRESTKFKHAAKLTQLIKQMIIIITIFLMTFILLSLGLYYGINHPMGFPWIAAFITAALLSTSTTEAISDYLESIKIPTHVLALLHSESVITEVIVIVLFNSLIRIALPTHEFSSLNYFISHLSLNIVGGILIGIIFGFIARLCLKITRDQVSQAFITVMLVYFTFIFAENILSVSGIVSELILGLMIGDFSNKNHYVKHDQFLDKFWETIVLVSNSGIFILVGITTTITIFKERWYAMIIAIISIIVARLGSVIFSLNICPLQEKFSFNEKIVASFGGIRGAIPIALAFSIPDNLSYWWTIQSIAFGVVLFTVIIQAPSLNLFKKKLKTNL